MNSFQLQINHCARFFVLYRQQPRYNGIYIEFLFVDIRGFCRWTSFFPNFFLIIINLCFWLNLFNRSRYFFFIVWDSNPFLNTASGWVRALFRIAPFIFLILLFFILFNWSWIVWFIDKFHDIRAHFLQKRTILLGMWISPCNLLHCVFIFNFKNIINLF